uniref:G-patch domain-containing protein n=3 Tax=Triticinae TaxID=1648030 RepID=A0A452YLD5_AEGTS
GRRVRPVREAMSSIGSSNIGFQLLKKSGWKEGTGLGAQEQGRLEPVETRVKNNKRGLGSKEPKPKPKVEDDVETAPSRRPKDAPVTKKAKLAAKRIRKMQEEEKKAQEREFEIAFFREFWPDNV